MTDLFEEAHPSYRMPVCSKWATDPTTTMQEEAGEAQQEAVEAHGTASVIVLATLGAQLLQGRPRAKRIVFVEAPIDQVGTPGEAVTTTAPWPVLWQEPEPHAEIDPLLGTFAPAFERDVLFTFDMDIEASRLEQWDPPVTLHATDFDPEDE